MQDKKVDISGFCRKTPNFKSAAKAALGRMKTSVRKIEDGDDDDDVLFRNRKPVVSPEAPDKR